jgi:NitT/TauT family transport system substrate-binding protein
MKRFFVLAVALLLTSTACAKEPSVVRVGHFPNVAHAQALILHTQGELEKALGPTTQVDWKVFNAGSSATEAIFAGQLDIAYIGPSPAINGYVKSGGEAVRVIAGAASGGAAFVVRSDLDISKPEDFKGKKIATPQLGNTQDVSLRSWLTDHALVLKDKGGDVQVLPLSNADQQTLFIKKEIDAAWTTEPWVSLLVKNAEGKIFLDESSLWPDGKYATALVVVRTAFLKQNPEIVKKFLILHVETTEWIKTHPDEAKQVIKKTIESETQKELPEDILNQAFGRIQLTYEPMKESVIVQGDAAFTAGYLKKKPDLTGLFDTTLLDEIIGNRAKK